MKLKRSLSENQRDFIFAISGTSGNDKGALDPFLLTLDAQKDSSELKKIKHIFRIYSDHNYFRLECLWICCHAFSGWWELAAQSLWTKLPIRKVLQSKGHEIPSRSNSLDKKIPSGRSSRAQGHKSPRSPLPQRCSTSEFLP